MRFTSKDSRAQYCNIESMMLSGDTTLAVGGDDEIKRTAERAACNPRER